MTRTNSKHTRVYLNGYDVSGTARRTGSFGATFDAPLDAAYTDAVMNTVIGNAQISCGPINAFLSPAVATGLHELCSAGNGTLDVLIAMGINAAPIVGVPVFAWKMEQSGYQSEGDGIVGVNISLSNGSYAMPKGYDKPFGLLLHANGAETAANTAVATIDNGAASTKGGIFVYQLLSSDGTVTLSVDDAAANTGNDDFGALSGATSGSITAAVTPKSGFVALATTATVKRYIRFQVAFTLGTTATFVCAFIRG